MNSVTVLTLTPWIRPARRARSIVLRPEGHHYSLAPILAQTPAAQAPLALRLSDGALPRPEALILDCFWTSTKNPGSPMRCRERYERPYPPAPSPGSAGGRGAPRETVPPLARLEGGLRGKAFSHIAPVNSWRRLIRERPKNLDKSPRERHHRSRIDRIGCVGRDPRVPPKAIWVPKPFTFSMSSFTAPPTLT
jgi:hypothetical protein